MAVRGRALVPSTASRVLIRVDDYSSSCMAGLLHNPYLKKSIRFSDVIDFTSKLDEMFDEISFPLAAVRYRSFGSKKKNQAAAAPANAGKAGEDEVTKESLNKKDSDVFVVHVQFRQNATWQGTVKWAQQNEEVRFRSTLELLKIMDSALSARYPKMQESDAEK